LLDEVSVILLMLLDKTMGQVLQVLLNSEFSQEFIYWLSRVHVEALLLQLVTNTVLAEFCSPLYAFCVMMSILF